MKNAANAREQLSKQSPPSIVFKKDPTNELGGSFTLTEEALRHFYYCKTYA